MPEADQAPGEMRSNEAATASYEYAFAAGDLAASLPRLQSSSKAPN